MKTYFILYPRTKQFQVASNRLCKNSWLFFDIYSLHRFILLAQKINLIHNKSKRKKSCLSFLHDVFWEPPNVGTVHCIHTGKVGMNLPVLLMWEWNLTGITHNTLIPGFAVHRTASRRNLPALCNQTVCTVTDLYHTA